MKILISITLSLFLFQHPGFGQISESPCTLQAGISVAVCIDYFCIPVESHVSGGTPPYQYQWFNGGTESQTDLNYGADPTGLDTCLTLTVTDAAGCIAIASFRYVYADWPGYPQTTVTLVDDTVTLDLVGGNIDIKSNDQAYARNYTLVQPPKHGELILQPDGTCTYTPYPSWCGPDYFRYTATDTGDCRYGPMTTVLIDQGPCANIIVNKTDCNNACSGSAIFYSNGVFIYPLSYLWSDGSTEVIADSLCEGEVSITVTDAIGTIEIYTANIESSKLEASISGPAVICNQQRILLDAEISVQNIPAYYYQWTGDGIYGGLVFDLPTNPYCSVSVDSALYQLRVRSADGCEITAEWEIEILPQLGFDLVVEKPQCPGDSLELSTIIERDGTPPYQYSWSGPNGVQSNWPELIWPNVDADFSGRYSIRVTDAKGCYSAKGVNIDIPDTCKYILAISGGTTVCTGSEMRLGFGLINGWVQPERIEWTGPNGFQSNRAAPLIHNAQPEMTGWYHLVIQFGNTIMEDSAYYTVSEEALYFTSIEVEPPIDCRAPHDGSVTFHVNTPPPYDVRFGNTGSFQHVTINPFIRYTVQQGNLGVEIKQDGCKTVKNVLIESPAPPDISVQQESCIGMDASIEVSSIHPSTLRWTLPDGTIFNTDQPTLTGLSPGIYKVTITDDSTGCKFNKTVELLPYLDFQFTIVDTPTCVTTDGTLLANYSGNATPPVVYEWNNGFIGNPATDLAPGGYSVTLTDDEGCSRHKNTVLIPEDACIAQISGHVYINTTCACTIDTTTVIFPFAKVCATNGEETVCTYTNHKGDYTLGLIEPGMYTITATTHQPNAQSVCTQMTYEVGQDITKDTSGVDFIFCGAPESDLDVQMYCGPARPGFEFTAFARVRNLGIWPADTSLLLLEMSPYISNPVFSPPPFSYDPVTRIAVWRIVKLGLYQQGDIQVSGLLTAALEDTLNMRAEIISLYTPDSFLENNISECANLVTGAFDPNDKLVSPIGLKETGDISAVDSVLTYTIRFQNTGTDTAFTVVVRDTLDTDVFDLNSFAPLYSSHPFFLDLEEGNILVFTFDPIHLPDSNRSEAGSKGFVMFSIQLKDGLPPGTKISNEAAIYFDYNIPVITDPAQNTIVKVSDQESIWLDISLAPNPVTDQTILSIQKVEGLQWAEMALFSMEGVLSKHFKRSTLTEQVSRIPIDTYDLPPGVYFLLIRTNIGQATKKLIVIRN